MVTSSMEIITKAFLFKGIRQIEEFEIKVNENNFRICIERLKYEHRKIINLLKEYKEQGIIITLCKPRNKQIQHDLDNLLRINKEIKKSIEKIKTTFK